MGIDHRLEQYGGRPDGLIPLRDHVLDPTLIGPAFIDFLGDHPPPNPLEAAEAPLVGVTTDGTVQPDLFQLGDQGFNPIPATTAAKDFLGLLSNAERATTQRPLNAPHWRMWTNAFPFIDQDTHGLLLAKAADRQRSAAMSVIEASLSAHGYQQTRAIMKLNEVLGEYIQQYLDSLTEWSYFFAIFGEPDTEQPWGWQLWGHHLIVSCTIIGRQMVLTPSFVGAEINFGPDGTRALDDERTLGFDLYSGLSATQRDTATLHRSIRAADLPHEINGKFDGRHLGGAGADNLVLPYAGLQGSEMTSGQREALMKLVGVYADRLPAGQREADMAGFERHLDDAWFSWIGSDDPDGAYYYRVHSPVLLIEYDNHPGIFLDNDEPEPFHIHTIVRKPNGGDYGADLLAQHYATGHSHQHSDQHDHDHD